MLTVRQSGFARNVVVPLTLFALLAGCTKWVPMESPYGEAITDTQPGRIRATLSDGRVVEIGSPRTQGDSIVGHVEREYRVEDIDMPPSQRVILAIADIDSLSERKTDVVLTAVGVTLLLVTAGTVAIVVALQDCCW